ncbi:MAG TPA: hypothetical protein VM120_23080 [Bryobacteraceae bacterium]|nr:hypothetical protein [Bryobacteraceae bacterium]
MAKKFILIDQSISSIAGHHYEYAVHVLEAAQRMGYEPYLGTHVRFAKSSHHSPWRTFPIYRFGFWAAQESAQFGLVNWILGRIAWLRFRWRLFYRFSLFGLLWAVRDRFGDFVLKQPLDRAHLLSLATLVPAAILLKLFRFLFLLLLLPVMIVIFLCRALLRLMKAGGFPERYLRSLLADAADALYFFRQIFIRRIGFLSWWQQYRCLAGFRTDTAKMLRDIAPGPGDVIFIPTLSGIELIGLAEYLRSEKPGPGWHLLFRRDIYPGRASAYGAEEWRVQGLRNSFLGSAPKLKGHDVRFYTDTDELTAQYNRLGVFSFRTLPIPHTHTPASARPDQQPLRIIYVGDARREKGYHYIPTLVEDLWNHYIVTGRVSFHLQSNFNIPQGEPAAVIAREHLEQLAQRAPSAIELIKHPMTSEQYKAFLLSGDINLLLYDAVNYYARSSGILVESLSAGVPVLVPAGSWLARQFRGALYEHLTRLRQELLPLKQYTPKDLRWQVYGDARANPLTASGLTASRDAKAFCWVRSIPSATHMIALLRFGADSTELMLHVEQCDARGNTIGTARPRLVEANEQAEAYELFILDSRTTKLWLSVASASPGDIHLKHLQLDFLATPPGESAPPQGAVGLVYHDPAEITAKLRELIDHHEHYSRTAREFAVTWQQLHNSERLVAELGR